ncbi:histidine phosphatase family protein [Terriglobus sp. 2YAB30_2]|uniref:histidine phosphatase family protein n=1 Tax=Terriglobus sp. 2YAB30_2 TaxID=3233023 RepID=UPI003F9A2ED4
MSELIFIRHAETDMAGRFCGHTDPSINQRGQIQVAALIARLGHGLEFNAIYSSDLQRAVDTAASIATAFLRPIHKNSGLREIHFGDWEGLAWREIEERDPIYAQSWIKLFPSLPAPNGESFANFEDRVVRTVERIRNEASGRNAVVTHAGVMRVVLCRFLGHTQQEAHDITGTYCCSFELQAAATTSEVTR